MKDKEVKEKLESLDPLSGGIVFGKEEAWDKLQARMDKPAAKKVVLWYRISAAAALLLCISVIGYYFYTPEKQVVINQPISPAVITDTEHMAVSTPTTIEPAFIATPDAPIVRRDKRKALHKKQDPPQTLFAIKEEPVTAKPEPIAKPVAPAPAVVVNNNSKPVVPPVKKMRVVHINDLGKTTDDEEPTIVYSGPTLDISKMKVVSLYDVQREESVLRQAEEMMTLVRINRPHGNMFSITNPLTRKDPYDRSFSQSPFTLRLNRNN